MVCSLERKYWNCLQLWWYKAGMRSSTGSWKSDGYTHLTEKELSELKRVGNVYDAINDKFGLLTGTRDINDSDNPQG